MLGAFTRLKHVSRHYLIESLQQPDFGELFAVRGSAAGFSISYC